MEVLKELIIFVAVFSFAVALDLPSNFQKCKRSENTNECLKGAIQDALPKLEKGISSFGFPSIKPLNIPSMTIGEGAGTVHVVQKYQNLNIFGISEAKIEKVKATLTPTTVILDVDAFMSDLKLEGRYDFNGRILVLPIVGNGKCTILLKNLKANLFFTGESFERKDKKYINMKDMKLTLKPEKVIFNFEDLFDGDQRLGQEMNNVLNENWKDVFEDIRSGYEEALALIIKNYANIIFKKVPYKDLILE